MIIGVLLSLNVLATLVALWLFLRSLHKTQAALEVIQQRFRDGGVDLVERHLTTDIRLPEPWANWDGIPDEDIERMSRMPQRRDEWVEFE